MTGGVGGYVGLHVSESVWMEMSRRWGSAVVCRARGIWVRFWRGGDLVEKDT